WSRTFRLPAPAFWTAYSTIASDPIRGSTALCSSAFVIDSTETLERSSPARRPSRKPLSTPPPWLRRGPMIKPLSLLNQRINSNVMVELKGGRGYRGILGGFDPHMNLVLRAAEE